MTKTKKKGNLTQKKGCYSYELRRHKPELALAAANENISTEDFRVLVLEAIEPAFIVKKAKPDFIARINQAPTKGWIMRYVLDAIEHGAGIPCDLD